MQESLENEAFSSFPGVNFFQGMLASGVRKLGSVRICLRAQTSDTHQVKSQGLQNFSTLIFVLVQDIFLRTGLGSEPCNSVLKAGKARNNSAHTNMHSLTPFSRAFALNVLKDHACVASKLVATPETFPNLGPGAGSDRINTQHQRRRYRTQYFHTTPLSAPLQNKIRSNFSSSGNHGGNQTQKPVKERQKKQ